MEQITWKVLPSPPLWLYGNHFSFQDRSTCRFMWCERKRRVRGVYQPGPEFVSYNFKCGSTKYAEFTKYESPGIYLWPFRLLPTVCKTLQKKNLDKGEPGTDGWWAKGASRFVCEPNIVISKEWNRMIAAIIMIITVNYGKTFFSVLSTFFFLCCLNFRTLDCHLTAPPPPSPALNIASTATWTTTISMPLQNGTTGPNTDDAKTWKLAKCSTTAHGIIWLAVN